MIQVKNRACVRTVAVRSLWASRMRNRIAVIAIMLTTMLFTALFTIAISINDSFQQSNFLMVGGDAHGAFKKLTEEQMETLKKDPLIQETGARLFLGMGTGDAFRKTQVEVSYMDAHGGKHYFCTPTHGHRPKEGSNEAMTDTRVKTVRSTAESRYKIYHGVSDRRGTVRTENGDAGVCSLRLVGLQRSFPGKQCDRAGKLCEKDIAECGDRGG